MHRLGLSLLSFLLSACCLDVVSGDAESDVSVLSTGGGPTGTGSGGRSTGAATSSGGQGCSYPTSPTPVFTSLFPDAKLGVGWVNFTGVVDTAATIGPAADVLLQLHCSGKRYALIDIGVTLDGASATASQQVATLVEQNASGWLAMDGLVLMVLEETRTSPATQQDLVNWIAQNPTSVSLVDDPSRSLISALGPVESPSFFVVRLADMASEETLYDDPAEIAPFYSDLLEGKLDGGF